MKDNHEEDLLNNTGNHEEMGDELEDMELDDSLLFGDEDDHEDYPEPEETAVDGSEGDVSNTDEESTQPEVIDTTGEQSKGDGDHDGDGKPDDDKQGVFKEIDGQLFVAVDANNSEVMGKDGKHKIPYEVLERARQGGARSKELESQVKDLQGQLETTSSKQKLFEKQLTEAGLDPDKLPEELLSDPQAAERIQEEYPGEAGKIIAALINKVQGQGGKQAEQPQQQQQEQPSNGNPVDTALAADELKELNGWRSDDSDRWEMALIIDEKLSNSPEFASKPIEARFAEVQRRVKATFGDPVQESVNQELAKQEQAKQPQAEQAKPKAAIPNSPSELGSSALDTTQASHEALASQDAMAMESSMAGMSDAQLEAFLEQAGMAFD